ncbi:MAG: hypothetical protein ACPGUY_04370, partial [Akkermansiaceae bacterium]
MKKLPLLAGLSLLSMGTTVDAALVHAGGNATLVSTTTFDGGAGSASVAGTSDGNTTSTANGQVFTNDPGGFPSDYFAVASAIIIDLDLGSTMSIDSIAFWNRGAASNGNATRSFNAVFSTDSTFGNGDDSSAFSFNPVNSGGNQQDFALGTTVNNAQFVRITIDDNDFGTFAGGDRVAFTEFQFNAVPEPSSTALLGL